MQLTINVPTHQKFSAFERRLHSLVQEHLGAVRAGTLDDWRREHGIIDPRVARAAVGQTTVNPYYGGVGQPISLNAYHPGGVGAPVQQEAPTQGVAPVTYSSPSFVAGGNSYLGLGLQICPAATDVATLATLIATRGKVIWNVKPIRPFNPMHLYFASTVIDLTVEAVKIQGIEVFSSEEPVFIEAFSEVSRVPAIQWLTINESTGVTLTVGNPTAAEALVKGTFHGTYVRQ